MDHEKLCVALKEIGVPQHLIVLIRSLYYGRETTDRTKYGKTEGKVKIGRRNINNLRNANDSILLAESVIDLK